MSKYQVYMTQSMLKEHLREIRGIMEYLDNAQELPKYYDSPDWNLNGRLSQDILRFDQFLNERLPDLEGIGYDSYYGPNWNPIALNRFAQGDGNLLALRSLRNFVNGSAFLHPSGEAFWGMQRSHSYKERFWMYEEEDVNDQNRFNLGHRPKEYGDGWAFDKMKYFWDTSYCPWGSEGTKQSLAPTLPEFREWEQLAMESYLTGESQKCNRWEAETGGVEVEIEMNSGAFASFGSAVKVACQPLGAWGPESPGYYMDLLRVNFPFNDDCYRRENMVGLPHHFGGVRAGFWFYLQRFNYFDSNTQGLYELWTTMVLWPALWCGNQRGKVISRVNKIHD